MFIPHALAVAAWAYTGGAVTPTRKKKNTTAREKIFRTTALFYRTRTEGKRTKLSDRTSARFTLQVHHVDIFQKLLVAFDFVDDSHKIGGCYRLLGLVLVGRGV